MKKWTTPWQSKQTWPEVRGIDNTGPQAEEKWKIVFSSCSDIFSSYKNIYKKTVKYEEKECAAGFVGIPWSYQLILLMD